MTRPTTLCLLAALSLGCATNYVGDVPEAGDTGDSSGANDGHTGAGPGDDGISGNLLDEGGTDGGDTEGASCLPLEEHCGEAPEDNLFTVLGAYRTPDLGFEPDGTLTDTGCTILSNVYDDAALQNVIEIDCGDEVHWQLWLALPEDALANLWVGRVIDVVYSWEDTDYQRNLSLLAGPGDPIFLAQNGRSVTPDVPSYDPFTVEVVTGDCLPYCVPSETCASTTLQGLSFGLGEETVDVWHANSATIGSDRTYIIQVGSAYDTPIVNPEAAECEYVHPMPGYWFFIAETTPVE